MRDIGARVSLPEGLSGAARLLRALGPGYLVAVGYLDPGNWATDLAAGSRTVLLLGEGATNQLLVLSQVVLSLQLPFAVIPLVWICGRRGWMGELRAPPWLLTLAWLCAIAIVIINASLLLSLLSQSMGAWLQGTAG
jgi:Mn2+/Fe2+ NRAMP family transporter